MCRHLRENFPGGADVVQPLQSKPDGLRAGLSVTLASQETAQASQHADGFPQTGWLRWGNWILANKADQGFPFDLFEINGAGYIRGFPPQFGQMKNSPGHDHVDRQAGFNAIGAT